jgi:polyisoprenoid-binding protein YceI
VDTEQMRGTPQVTEVLPQVGTQTVWAIDTAHTLVEFAVKHMMFTTVKGRFTDVRGTIRCPSEPGLNCTSVTVAIAAASIDTGELKRDAHLRSADFLDVEHFPTMTFTSTRVERTDADQVRVIGNLTIRGVTRQVTLETAFTGRGKNLAGKEAIGFSARTRLNRKDFGLQWNMALESGGVLVGDVLDVQIEVEAVKQD